MVATEFLIAIATLLATVYYFATRRPKNFPPGPKGLPFLGNLTQIKAPAFKYFKELGETHGDIIGLYFGSNPTVVLNNYKHIREAFANKDITGRPQTHMMKERGLGANRGVLFAQGHVWSEQRKFSTKTLREFGFGKKSMEPAILDEVNELIAGFRRDSGKPINSQRRFNLAVLNVLWVILTGVRYSHDDPQLVHLMNVLTDAVRSNPTSGKNPLQENFPLILWLCTNLIPSDDSVRQKFLNCTFEMIADVLKQHIETLQEYAPRDFIDVYLNEINRTKEKNSSFYQDEGHLQLKVLLLDMFSAGAETTSTTLAFSFLYMALYPDKQQKVFEEIMRVVGNSRNVSLTDRPEMPYTEACIMEIQRFCTVIPLAPHCTHKEVQFQGYTLPKGTTVLGNLWAACRDVQAWGDPENFRPERFLSPDGKSVVRHEAFLPFSHGKRVCLGETVAKAELFLFLTNLLQVLQVKCVDGEPKPKNEASFSIVMAPKAHRLVVLDRQGQNLVPGA